MKASFDGARINLAAAFDKLAAGNIYKEQIKPMRELRAAVGALLCMYDDTRPDCNDLSHIDLQEVP